MTRLMTGAGIGVALTYFFDPRVGKRRRSLLRDQIFHVASRTSKALDVAWRDLQHRVCGSFAELRSALGDGNVSDEVLVERVRSRMGRHVAHPSAIDVTATSGRLTLTGHVLDQEEPNLLSAVRSVRGVKSVESLLEVHSRTESVPELQGSGRRTGKREELMQEMWTPTTRLIAGATGWVLMANCLARRTPGSIVGGTFGFGLFLRALTNTETKRMLGIAPARRGIELRKTMTIHAPLETVYSLLTNSENYPRLTSIVTSARKIADDRCQLQIAGPMGARIKLDEIITRSVPFESVAWESGPDSDVEYAGEARFEPTNDAGTRVEVRFTYNPPGGILSHTAARFIGFDAKALLDDIFMRAKSYLETGRQPHDAAEQTTPEVQAGRTDGQS